MSLKNKTISKKYTLVAWQDSDVPDQIKDHSFAGRLVHTSLDKENNPSDEPTLLKTNDKSVKKKRVSKRPSIAASTAAVNELNLDQMTVSDAPKTGSKLSAHFVLANQAADGGLVTSKTSNNKLEQEHRISYHEMCQVLKSYRNEATEEAIQSLNSFYETQYFPEWFRLMRFVVESYES